MPVLLRRAFLLCAFPVFAASISACAVMQDVASKMGGRPVHPQMQYASAPEQQAFYGQKRRPINNPPVDGDPRHSGMYGQSMNAMPAMQAPSSDAGFQGGLPPVPSTAGEAASLSYPGVPNGFSPPGSMTQGYGQEAYPQAQQQAGPQGASPYAAYGQAQMQPGMGMQSGAAPYGGPQGAASPYPVGYGAPQQGAAYGADPMEMPLQLDGGNPADSLGDANYGVRQNAMPYRNPAPAVPAYGGYDNSGAYPAPQNAYPPQQQAYPSQGYGQQPMTQEDAYGQGDIGAMDSYPEGAYNGVGEDRVPYLGEGYPDGGGGSQTAQQGGMPSYGSPPSGGGQMPDGYASGPYAPTEGANAPSSHFKPRSAMPASRTSVPASRLRYATRNKTSYYNSFLDTNPVASGQDSR